MNKKPTFFISSTIYDFRDLRSALKFYLEELGYQVYASEYNDFKVANDKHSYDACLKLIEECDYFILLVGSRVGGFYDIENKISITRQEYREAYKLHEQGKLQIISFVRDDVWQLKEIKHELVNHLKEIKVLDEEIRNEVLNFDTKFANNAELISDFIIEVGRNNETRNSIKTGTTLPTGNWIRQFKSFKDVIEGIRPFILIEDLNIKFHKELLRNELIKHNLSLYGDFKENPKKLLIEFRNIYNSVASPASFLNDVEIRRASWERFVAVYHYSCLMPISLDLHIIYKTLTSDVFYNYDVSTNTLIKQPIHDTLSQLKNNIVSYSNSKEKSENYHKEVLEIRDEFPDNDTINISASYLMKVLAYFSNIVDIHLISISVIKSLESGTYESPELCDIDGLLKKILAL